MTRYRAHGSAAAGIYMNPRRFSFVSLEKDGDLPGTPGESYLRVPAVVLLMIAPLVGGLFVVFLPLIGFVMLAWVAGAKMHDLLARSRPTPIQLHRT